MLHKIALSTAFCILVCLRAGAQDRSTPEATVRSFLTAFGKGDMKTSVVCVKGATLNGPALDALGKQIQAEPATTDLTDAKTTVTGNTAVVTGNVSMKFPKSDKPQVSATQVKLVLEGGSWSIVPDPLRAKMDSNPDMLNSLAYVLTDSQVFTRAREAARAVSCLSNVKQISVAALMYAQDYDEVYKLKAESYKKSLMPYIKNESLFHCPSDTGKGVSYAFNRNLAGVKLAKIRKPAQTVFIYEGANMVLNFRHDGKASISFADGHAKRVDAKEAKTLKWMP